MSVPSYPSGTRYIPNNIAVMNQKYAGEANDSNAKLFDPIVPHSMPVDTVHTLGADTASGTWIPYGTNTITDNGGGSFTINIVDDVKGAYMMLSPLVASSTYAIGITEFIYSGSVTTEVMRIFGTSDIALTFAGGTQNYIAQTTSGSIYFNNLKLGQTLRITFTAKEITLPTASYIQYLAYQSLTWKQLSSTVDYGYGLIPVSTTWPLTESFQIAITSTAPLSAADILELNADQDLMFKVLFDGYVLPSGYSSANIVGFLDGTSGNTGDYNVYDITDQTFSTFKTIANGSPDVNTTYLNGTTGVTNLKLIKDASGRTTGTAAAGTISHTSDGYVDTKFLPNLSIYTIEETVTGNLAILDVLGVPTGAFSVRTETRRLIHEAGVGDSLYIDTVLQPYTPSLPNPLVSIKLGNTAVIGYADTITSRSSKFIAKAIVSVP